MIAADRIAPFLAAAGWGDAVRQPLAGDASARRYERLRRGGATAGGATAVLMDSPDPAADVVPFVAVGRILGGLGLSVPAVLAAAPQDGLLLLEDFGDGTFSRLLEAGAESRQLYALAVDALVALHRGFDPAQAAGLGLPVYDAALFVEQVMLIADVAVPAATGRRPDAQARASLERAWFAALEPALALPPTLLLRDFHVDNLMHLPERPGVAACGLLDFQGAGLGPACYDLVSLLEDARRDVPDSLKADLAARYRAAFPDLDAARFELACAVLGAVRHARIVAVFMRLAAAGKGRYLAHLPRVWRLLDGRLGHPALEPVRLWLDRHFPAGSRPGPFRPEPQPR